MFIALAKSDTSLGMSEPECDENGSLIVSEGGIIMPIWTESEGSAKADSGTPMTSK